MDPNQLSRTFPIPKPTHFFPLSGGGNNRLFKLEFKDRNPLVLKQYFQHPNDLRPRLHAEFSFLKYAWNIGIRNIPEPLYASANSNEALYSFLPCNPIQVGDITDSLVQQILSFFHSLNQQKQQATDLPKASEACFCANDYLEITEKRVLRLLTIPDETPIEKEVKFFVIQNLIPKWEKL
ncbi:MAG TPA: hypothetical protein VLE89_05245, partial [Chlamydiales bacterium]|nr:hypothetical protein [Chlamydiales bacterium]